MKKYIKIAIFGVLSWALGACSDSVERDPSPTVSPDCVGVYFSESNTYNYELDPAITSITLTVGRDKSDVAVTVPVKVISNSDNIFVVPESVSFAAGEAETTLEVTFPNAEIGTEYSFELTFDSEYINPYKGASLSRTVMQLIKWESVGTGVWVDGTISAAFGVNLIPVAVELEKADLGNSIKYRFYNAYAPATEIVDEEYGIYNGYPYNMTVLEENCAYVITKTDQGFILNPASMGMTLNATYGLFSLGTVYRNLSDANGIITDLKTYPLGTQEGDVITFPLKSLYLKLADYGVLIADANPTLLYLSVDAYKASVKDK